MQAVWHEYTAHFLLMLDGLGKMSQKGTHQHRDECEPAVLDLLDLELSKHLRVVSQTQGVEWTTCMPHEPLNAPP